MLGEVLVVGERRELGVELLMGKGWEEGVVNEIMDVMVLEVEVGGNIEGWGGVLVGVDGV